MRRADKFALTRRKARMSGHEFIRAGENLLQVAVYPLRLDVWYGSAPNIIHGAGT